VGEERAGSAESHGREYLQWRDHDFRRYLECNRRHEFGNASGGLALNGGELLADNGFSIARLVDLMTNGGTLAAVPGGRCDVFGKLLGLWELDHWGYGEHRCG
jgi:hypothetical protein